MTLRILHISDLHFRALEKNPVESFNADFVTAAMVRAIEDMVKEGVTFDLVIVTGDLAHSGAKTEYDVAEEFCRRVREATQLPNSMFFVVPGNHDVDRVKVTKRHIETLYRFENQDQITATLLDKDFFPILMKKFSEYMTFANIVLGSRLMTDTFYYYTKEVHLQKENCVFSLNLLGLNSALFAGYDGDDNKHLALGLHQVEYAIRQCSKDALFTLAFFHHPFSCFHPEDRVPESMIRQNAGLILHGHLHEPSNAAVQDSDGNVVIVGAGASFEKREYENSFNLIEIDPLSGKGRVIFYKYLHKKHCWVRNYDINPHKKDGSFEFCLELKDADKKITKVSKDYSHPVEADLTQYLSWLEKECGYIDIRGLAVGSGKAHRIPIEKLYIPLTTMSSHPCTPGIDEIAEKSVLVSNRMEERQTSVPLQSVLDHQYVTIMGDPGSGKTTFVRYIAATLGRTLLERDPDMAKGMTGLKEVYFPIFIRASELARFIIHSKNRIKDSPALDDDPRWFILFLQDKNESLHWGLPDTFFARKLNTGTCLLLLDGLDEAPGEKSRIKVRKLLENTMKANAGCRFAVTTRPQAYDGDTVLAGFSHYTISDLSDDAVKHFLGLWSRALFAGPGMEQKAEEHYNELLKALSASRALRRLVLNPMMLTALAVIHWNQKRLPEQRAALYDSIITWLLRSREDKPDRLSSEQCLPFLCKLALSMQTDKKGRQVQLERRKACEILAPLFKGETEEQQLACAEEFCAKEEMDSGIIVEQDGVIRFRHLTFQEYLCAKALAGKPDHEQKEILLNGQVIFQPEWKEVILLFCGIMCEQGRERLDGFLKALLAWQKGKKDLQDRARVFGLFGAIERDLLPYNYRLNDPLFFRLKDDVMAIFDRDKARTIQAKIRCDAADALGQAGDPRLLEDNFVTIPACTFLMGAQKNDEKAPNYDPDADPDESPVHEVRLSEYKIGKFPVTVGEYSRFIDAGGYKNKDHWQAGGFGEYKEPENWETQVQFPTRPVVSLSWFEAKAYTAWFGKEYDLPSEAQWERAAKGPGNAYRKYPWGNDEPDGETANWDKTGLQHPSPVGIFPLDQTEEGVYDMGGNVWEWCLDWKDVKYSDESSFYEKSAGSTDPLNDETGKWGKTGNTGWRVLRGGSWAYGGMLILRCCDRDNYEPAIQNSLVGIRVVRVVR